MSFEGGNRLYGYETRCNVSEIKDYGERASPVPSFGPMGNFVAVAISAC